QSGCLAGKDGGLGVGGRVWRLLGFGFNSSILKFTQSRPKTNTTFKPNRTPKKQPTRNTQNPTPQTLFRKRVRPPVSRIPLPNPGDRLLFRGRAQPCR